MGPHLVAAVAAVLGVAASYKVRCDGQVRGDREMCSYTSAPHSGTRADGKPRGIDVEDYCRKTWTEVCLTLAWSDMEALLGSTWGTVAATVAIAVIVFVRPGHGATHPRRESTLRLVLDCSDGFRTAISRHDATFHTLIPRLAVRRRVPQIQAMRGLQGRRKKRLDRASKGH